MTREEFINKFPVGSKVRATNWDNDDFERVICYGEKRFFSIDQDGNEDCWFYCDTDWISCEEPKPQYKIMSPALILEKGKYVDSRTLHENEDDARRYFSSFSKFISWPATQVITIPKEVFRIFRIGDGSYAGPTEDLVFETPVQFKVEVKK